MKYLIVNADDLGLTDGVSRGILEGIQQGIVTRTSAMVCTEGRDQLMELINQIPGRVGLHLQLTDGTPLSPLRKVSSLVTEEGSFARNKKSWLDPNPEEVRTEWEAQIQWMLDHQVQLTHLDSHHNVHRYPAMLRIYVELARKYGLTIRPLTTNMENRFRMLGARPGGLYYDAWDGENVTPKTLMVHILGAFRRIKNEGAVEFVCHPGYVDKELEKRAWYLNPREKELRALCDPSVKEFLQERGIQLAVGNETILN